MALITWTDGQLLDAADLNGNFGQVEADIAAVRTLVPTPPSRASFTGYTVATWQPTQTVVSDPGPTQPLILSTPYSNGSGGMVFVGVPVPATPTWSAELAMQVCGALPPGCCIGIGLYDHVSGRNSIWGIQKGAFTASARDQFLWFNCSGIGDNGYVNGNNDGNTLVTNLGERLGFKFNWGPAGMQDFAFSRGAGLPYVPVGALAGVGNANNYVSTPTHVGLIVSPNCNANSIVTGFYDGTPVVLALEHWLAG